MKPILAFAALALVATGATAGPAFERLPQVPAADVTALRFDRAAPPPGLVTIFDNINRKQLNNEYNCCFGFAVSGPNNTIGAHMLFDAMGFTPQSNLKVTEIDIAAAYGSGTNEFSLALYNDKGGVPGTALKVWQITNLQPYNACCALTVATAPGGIPVTAGQRYWVVMRTDHASLNTTMFWDTNVLNTTTHYPFSQYCSNDVAGTPCTTPNDQWTTATIAPALAFAMFGTP